MKTALTLIAAGILALTMAGCNTIAGAGKDVARGGEKIQDASAKVRSEWRDWRNRHDRDYDSARTGCPAGAAGDACRDQARASYRAQLEENRAKHRRSEMRAQSEEDRMEDAYEAARDGCSALRGADEDRCVADARAKYRR